MALRFHIRSELDIRDFDILRNQPLWESDDLLVRSRKEAAKRAGIRRLVRRV